jgi:hypothetical protein
MNILLRIHRNQLRYHQFLWHYHTLLKKGTYAKNHKVPTTNTINVADLDPYVFGPPGSWSEVGIRILLSSSKNSKKNLHSYSFVTSLWLLKSNMQKNLENKIVFCWRLEGQWRKIAASGSIDQCTDPRIRIRNKMSWIRNTAYNNIKKKPHLMPCAWRHSAKWRWNAFGPCASHTTFILKDKDGFHNFGLVSVSKKEDLMRNLIWQ